MKVPLDQGDPLRKTLDSLLVGFQLIGFDWTWLYVNPFAATQGHRTPAELIGRLIGEAFPGIEQTHLFEHLRRTMEDRATRTFETEFPYPDGQTRWFEIRVEAVPQGICVYSTDIHERKQAEAERSRLASEVERQRLRVFRATMTTVHHIVNNILNNLQLLRIQAEDRLTADEIALLDSAIADGTNHLQALGNLQRVQEFPMAIGEGIQYPAPAADSHRR